MPHLDSCHDKTDEQLVALTLTNQEFFGCLIARYEQKLLRYIRRISKFSTEEAEDILQECFIKAYYNLNGFDTSLKFSSWIYRITHNQVISAYRKHSIRPEGNTYDIDEHMFANIAADIDITKELETHFLRKTINSILDAMDPKYREVLVLQFFEEKEYKEISDILQKPVGTVGTLINRAKKQFRHLAQQQYNELSV